MHYARDKIPREWEDHVRVSWLVGMLTSVGFNDPKNFPKSPEELLKKKQAEPFTARQWAATFSQLLGRPVKVDPSVMAE